jgi:glycosyltransferase involved in cell wall biosynthesis
VVEDAPEVSIVIPVHNEEPILEAAVVHLCDRLAAAPFVAEVWLAENGSSDATVEVAHALAASPITAWRCAPASSAREAPS